MAILRPYGEVVAAPFEVGHTDGELKQLTALLRSLPGETRVVMECTGTYYQPIAYRLHEEDFYVSAVHAQLIHKFGNNTIRKVKTDAADALKIASYALTYWLELPRFYPEEDIRRMLQTYSRQYSKYGKLKTMLKNNFIALTDQTFPGVNELFTSPARQSDGHQKWMDFAFKFWHCECVCDLTPKVFAQRYRKWCKQNGYRFSEGKALDIYALARGHIGVMPKSDSTKLLMTLAVSQLNAVSESMAAIATEMKRLASLLPEYPVVAAFYGVGDILAPQIMAEIGDVYRFRHKGALVRFVGLEPPEYQSGKFKAESRSISKQGSPHLRRALFLVMDCLLKNAPANDPVYQFLDRKRAEGKHYYNYMNAGCAKFLRIYYARVKEYLDSLEPKA